MTDVRPSRNLGLDGLRGIAVLLVILNHTHVRGTAMLGTVGVTVFFVISGYLITGILISDVERRGGVDFRMFWARRARRILPPLVVVLVVLWLAARTTGVSALAPGRAVVGAIVFCNNWLWAGGVDLGGLNHTWSLAVEEQFYLVWPLLVALVVVRRGAVRTRVAALAAFLLALSLLLAASDAYQVAHHTLGSTRAYAGTDARAYALLLGGLLACLRAARRPMVVLTGVVWLPLLPFLLADPGSRTELILVAPLAAAAAGVVIWLRCPGAWLRMSWLRYVGRRSYALYLWHYPLMVVAAPRIWPSHTHAAAALAALVALACAEVSYRCVERPLAARGPGVLTTAA